MSGRALLLCCGTFDDPGLPALRSPSRDAEAFGQVLTKVGYEVTSVVNCTGQAARLAVAQFLREAPRTGVNLIYFSSHGVQDQDDGLYFAFRDTQPTLPDATGVSAEFVRKHVGQSPSRSTIMIIDSCFSGAFTHGMAATPIRDAGVGALIQGMPDGSGVAVLTSSSATEVSLENPAERGKAERRGSYFTEALMAGLSSGNADHNNDGKITVDELFAYASERVAKGPAPQTPRKFVHAAGELVVAEIDQWTDEPPLPPSPPAAEDTMLLARAEEQLPPWPPLPPVVVAFAPVRPPSLEDTLSFPPVAVRPRWHVPAVTVAATLLAVGGTYLMIPDSARPASEAATQPSAGSPSTVPQAVELPIVVPDVIGDREPVARQALTDAGFVASAGPAETGNCVRGQVVRQAPVPGVPAGRGTTVVYTMCTHRPAATTMPTSTATADPTATTSSEPAGEAQVDVPCTLGQPQDVAQAVLANANLASQIASAESDAAPGTVIDQRPDCGSRADAQSSVLLVIAAAPDPTDVPTTLPPGGDGG